MTIGLALALLLGTVLHGVGALFHPMLHGDAEAHLRTIAGMSQWRPLHLAMLFGSGLIVAGVWVRLVNDRTFVRPALVAALSIVALGIAINALNTAYMARAGWDLAARFAAGDASVAALYDATHPIGLMAARFGNFVIALGALVLGFAEWHDPKPRRLDALLAWLAGVAGLIGALFFDESSRNVLAAVAVLSGWQVVTAVRALGVARSVKSS
jgi:hypothetical protein